MHSKRPLAYTSMVFHRGYILFSQSDGLHTSKSIFGDGHFNAGNGTFTVNTAGDKLDMEANGDFVADVDARVFYVTRLHGWVDGETSDGDAEVTTDGLRAATKNGAPRDRTLLREMMGLLREVVRAWRGPAWKLRVYRPERDALGLRRAVAASVAEQTLAIAPAALDADTTRLLREAFVDAAVRDYLDNLVLRDKADRTPILI